MVFHALLASSASDEKPDVTLIFLFSCRQYVLSVWKLLFIFFFKN